MDLKKNLVKATMTLPNQISYPMLLINRWPGLIYGKRYTDYGIYLQKNRRDYDNTSDLLHIVNDATKNVKFYRERYQQVSSLFEFKNSFGFIDKDTIRENQSDFISDGFNPSKYHLATTGGTSGSPLEMYIRNDRHIVELATMHMLWAEIGYNHDTRGVIRNSRLKNDEAYTVNPLTKEVVFDGFRLNEKYLKEVALILQKLKIPFLHAYPSAAIELAKATEKFSISLPDLKGIMCGSENIYNYQQQYIEHTLKVKVYSFYGHSEKLALGGYCHNSDIFHMEPTYGYVELLDEHNKDITVPGKVGEIVATTLHNSGMPLIRYRTDDFAEYTGNHCPYCNRDVLLLKNIRGRRKGTKLYGADGSNVTPTALNFHDDLYSHITGLQYIQKEKGTIQILVIKRPSFGAQEEIRLNHHYRTKFSPETKIEIKYVDHLIKKENGKLVEVISTV